MIVGLLVALYVTAVLRHGEETLGIGVGLIAVAYAVIFMTRFEQLVEYFPIVRLVLLLTSTAIIFGAYIYLWKEVCDDNDIAILKGISVLSFGLFIFSLIVDFANDYLNVVPERIIILIKHQIRMREILLAITVVSILIAALANAVKNKIDRPRDLFRVRTDIQFWNPAPEHNQFTNLLTVVLKALYNGSLIFYKQLTEFLKVIANVVNLIIQYLISFFINYGSEILKLIGKLLTVFYELHRDFFRNILAPFLLSYAVAILALVMIGTIYSYINEDVFTYLLVLLIEIVGLSFSLMLFFWSVNRKINFSDVLYSISVSNVAIFFLFTVVVLITSLELWLGSQFVQESPYKSLSYFTIITALGLSLTLIGLFVMNNLKRKDA